MRNLNSIYMMNLILLLTLTYSSNSFAQITLRNESLIYPDSLVAYLGATNRFLISGLQDSSSCFIVAHEDTFYIHEKGFNYTHHKVKFDTLKLYQNQSFVQSFIIEVRYWRAPNFTLGTLKDSIVSSRILANNLFLSNVKCVNSDDLYRNTVYVTRIELTLIKTNGDTIELRDKHDDFDYDLEDDRTVQRNYQRKFKKDEKYWKIIERKGCLPYRYNYLSRTISKLKIGDRIDQILIVGFLNGSCARYFSTDLKFTILN